MDKLIETFCDVDDFCKLFIEQWRKQLLENGTIKRQRACRLSPAEIMTIIIHFHQSHYRDFKNYYLNYVYPHLRSYFPAVILTLVALLSTASLFFHYLYFFFYLLYLSVTYSLFVF